MGDREREPEDPELGEPIAQLATFYQEPRGGFLSRIRATIAAQDDPELDDVMIVRRATDLDSTHTFAFARMIAESLLS